MSIAAASDTGRARKNNEDSYFIYQNEALIGGCVADGMGGHNSGELASAMACDLIKQYIISRFSPAMDYMEMSELIRRAFVNANTEIYKRSKAEPQNSGMGTTGSMAVIYKSKLIVAHVGDSRVYKLKGGNIYRITEDHSFVGELVRMGEINEQTARLHPNRNYITRALGAEPDVRVDMHIEQYDRETIVICSDGLSNMVSDEQIQSLIAENETLKEGAAALIELANRKGGNDNITLIIFDNSSDKE